ncbi:hypothetical protein CPT32_25410 [Rhizobium sophoriradicis]|nr:hypothetical protein CPT32_25410 [Rhizobium sophoriradicis]
MAPAHRKSLAKADDFDLSVAVDFLRCVAKMSLMVEQDTHIVSRFAGIPLAGYRDVDHAI